MNYSDLTCHTPPPLTWSDLSTELEDSHSDYLCIPLHLQVPHHTDMAMWAKVTVTLMSSWTKSNTSTADWVLLYNPIYIDCSRVFCHLGVESCGLPGEGGPTMTSSILILTTQSSLQTSPSICLLDYHLMPRYSLYFHQFLENFRYIFITFILRNIFCGFSFFHINGIIMVRS